MWEDFWDAFIYFPDDPFKVEQKKAKEKHARNILLHLRIGHV